MRPVKEAFPTPSTQLGLLFNCGFSRINIQFDGNTVTEEGLLY
jgi:hypothetical protein